MRELVREEMAGKTSCPGSIEVLEQLLKFTIEEFGERESIFLDEWLLTALVESRAGRITLVGGTLLTVCGVGFLTLSMELKEWQGRGRSVLR